MPHIHIAPRRIDPKSESLARGIQGMGQAVGTGLMQYGQVKQAEKEQLMSQAQNAMMVPISGGFDAEKSRAWFSAVKKMNPGLDPYLDEAADALAGQDWSQSKGVDRFSDADKSLDGIYKGRMEAAELAYNDALAEYDGPDPSQVGGERPVWLSGRQGDWDKAQKINQLKQEFMNKQNAYNEFLQSRGSSGMLSDGQPAPKQPVDPSKSLGGIAGAVAPQAQPVQGPQEAPAERATPQSPPALPKELQVFPAEIQKEAMNAYMTLTKKQGMAPEQAWQYIMELIQENNRK